jgi:hypothetical protein
MEEQTAPSREELIDILEETLKRIDELPTFARYDFVTHADLGILIRHLVAIFKAPL